MFIAEPVTVTDRQCTNDSPRRTGAGLVLGSLSVAASGFGGGWKQDSNTGTLYYDAGKPAQHHMNVPHGKSQKPTAANSFGNGWIS